MDHPDNPGLLEKWVIFISRAECPIDPAAHFVKSLHVAGDRFIRHQKIRPDSRKLHRFVGAHAQGNRLLDPAVGIDLPPFPVRLRINFVKEFRLSDK